MAAEKTQSEFAKRISSNSAFMGGQLQGSYCIIIGPLGQATNMTLVIILRDIRHGLLQIGREGGRLPSDDTYMYDDDARCAGMATHWYDEPPFESDPEDFLMDVNGGQTLPSVSMRNNRVCFTLNLRPEPRGEGVISLRSAGDISLPHCANGGAQGGLTPRGSARRGLLLPHGNHMATIIDRGSGDYAGSDVQSIGSRLSTMSIETSRSEHVEASIHSPSYLSGSGTKSRPFRKLVSYKCRSSASEEAVSASQSSDYEDQEDLDQLSGVLGRSSGRSGTRSGKTPEAFPSASSVESLPSGSGSSTQALMPTGSNHSSASPDDTGSPAGPVPATSVIGRARALVDYNSPYDREALRFKKGDLIDIVSMNASGIWKGVSNNRVGTFKFINVEMIPDKSRTPVRHRKYSRQSQGKPGSVEELLKKINLEEHISVFVLNGYEDLELFKDLENQDLDYLGINVSEHRAKILTAIQLLHDLDSGASADDTDGRVSTSDEEIRSDRPSNTTPSFRRLHFPRDSGCYDASRPKKNALNYGPLPHHRADSPKTVPNNFPNNLDSGLIAYKQSLLLANISEPIKTVKQELIDSPDKKNSLQQNYLPNIPVSSEMSPKSEVILTKSDTVVSPNRTLDSYVVARGKLVTVEPCRKGSTPVSSPVSGLRSRKDMSRPEENGRVSSRVNEIEVLEDTCETNSKLTMVKYVVGGNSETSCEGGNAVNGRGCCFSEKSSDSGVSSSSLSSAHPRDSGRKERSALVPALTESPTRGFVAFSNNASSPVKAKECV